MTTALPPFVLHTLTPISPATALTSITEFLTTANDTAAYRPDSTLSARGPISTSTSSPNLTLHHLNRIKLGLSGHRIGTAEIEAEDAVAEAAAEEERASRNLKRKRDREEGFQKQSQETDRKINTIPTITATTEEDGEVVVQASVEDGGDWEQKDDYELAQDEAVVDMNSERDPAGGLEQPADTREAEDPMEIEETQPGDEVVLPMQDSAVDKEERKRLKKLKQKEEKQKAEVEGKARTKKDKKKVKVTIHT
jgi:hypothetical protein